MAPRRIADVALYFDIPRPGGSVFASHAPLARCVVGGTPTSLIVDTGATDTILTRTFAEELGASFTLDEPGMDHSGAEVETWRADASYALDFVGVVEPLERPLVIECPPVFDEWGVGGVLSPQTVRTDLALVLDLTNASSMEWWEVGAPGDLHELVRARHPELSPLHLERVPGEGDAERLVMTRASVDGAEPVVAWMNTGGKQVEVAQAGAPHLEGAAERAVGKGVSGRDVRGARYQGSTLRVGEATFEVPELLLRDQGEHADGQIGMDLMAGSVLVVGPDDALTWWVLDRFT